MLQKFKSLAQTYKERCPPPQKKCFIAIENGKGRRPPLPPSPHTSHLPPPTVNQSTLPSLPPPLSFQLKVMIYTPTLPSTSININPPNPRPTPGGRHNPRPSTVPPSLPTSCRLQHEACGMREEVDRGK